jgi:hypothetical protein
MLCVLAIILTLKLQHKLDRRGLQCEDDKRVKKVSDVVYAVILHIKILDI